MRWLFFFFLLRLLGVVSAVSLSGNRLLVIVEQVADKNKYSKYFADIEGRGYKLSFESPRSEKVGLFELGERAYDHLLLLPTKSKGLGANLTPKLLLDFVNGGGNILLTLSGHTATPTTLIALLLELDIRVPTDRNSLVVDHFNFDINGAAEKHDIILLPRPSSIRPDVRNFFGGNGNTDDIIAFPRGVGQSMGNSSPLLTPILRAPRTAYSYNTKDEVDGVEDPFGVGEQLSLVTTMQARNSARFAVLGSSEMLEDAWFDAEVKGGATAKASKTANREFAREVTGWTFNEVGMLRVNSITHYLHENGIKSNITDPKIYRVKNDVISLSEYLWDRWTPFVPPVNDFLQLEFSMLSPFHRIPLVASETTSDATIYTASLRTPDQHGIFNFKFNYKRPFYNNIEEKNQVTVRHIAHDEYPRSWTISGAWPWISGVGVTVVGWVAFVAIWLWSRPVNEAGRRGVKKTQ